jgi:hypothetical protein
MNLSTVEIKAFVPARDFERSIQFYQAVGFILEWSNGDLACFSAGSTSFLLQDFFVEEHASNFMMHMLVECVDDWHRNIVAARIAETFGVRLGEPEDRAWKIRDFTLFDPTGVLWRIGQLIR